MHLKKAILPTVGLGLLLTACGISDNTSIKDAITQRERDKGYMIDGTTIVSKTETNGHLKVIFRTKDGSDQNVVDTVSFSRTGDGVLVAE